MTVSLKPAMGLHVHMLAIINTESKRFADDSVVKILDVGCGYGELIAYLTESLPLLNPSLKFEIYGCDVVDVNMQKLGFIDQTVKNLNNKLPNIEWSSKINGISVSDKWPYPDSFFDVIISNQVLEHAKDKKLFFSEIKRTLKKSGYSVHLFPLKCVLFDQHLNLPFVHKFINTDLLKDYINFMSRLKMGNFKERSRTTGVSLDEYSISEAAAALSNFNYMTDREALILAKRYDLCVSFRYTHELYINKLRSILKLPTRYEYENNRVSLFDWFHFNYLKYISSVTLYLDNSFPPVRLPEDHS
jgi:SAM-dependent methyltransferase